MGLIESQGAELLNSARSIVQGLMERAEGNKARLAKINQEVANNLVKPLLKEFTGSELLIATSLLYIGFDCFEKKKEITLNELRDLVRASGIDMKDEKQLKEMLNKVESALLRMNKIL